MFGIGGSELMVIVLVAILVFGPRRIPEVARTVAKGYREFSRWRKQLDSSVDKLRQEIDLNIDGPGLFGKSTGKRPWVKDGTSASKARSVPGKSRPVTQDVDVPVFDDYLAPPSYDHADAAAGSSGPIAPPAALAADDYLSEGTE